MLGEILLASTMKIYFLQKESGWSFLLFWYATILGYKIPKIHIYMICAYYMEKLNKLFLSDIIPEYKYSTG